MDAKCLFKRTIISIHKYNHCQTTDFLTYLPYLTKNISGLITFPEIFLFITIL